MNRVLVTGALGQLGLSIQDIATEYTDLEFVFTSSEMLDITDKEKVNKVFESGNFNWCINCAAYTNVEQAEKSPEIAFKVNADGVKFLALACKKNKVILIHISTDYIFDGEKGAPYKVDDEPNPINEYGRSKLKGEQYIQQILSKSYVVRTSWLYHKKHGKNFYKTILEKAKNGEVLRISDQEKGCPTNANNLAKFVIEQIVLNNTDYGIYHFTDGVAMTWYAFAEKIIKEKGLSSTTRVVRDINYRSFAARPKYSVLGEQ